MINLSYREMIDMQSVKELKKGYTLFATGSITCDSNTNNFLLRIDDKSFTNCGLLNTTKKND